MKQRDLFAELHEIARPVVEVETIPGRVICRPYQEQSIAETFTAWDGGYRSVLISMATGLGKSVVFSEIMRRMADRGRIMLLAHRHELIHQAKQHAERAGLTAGVEMGPDRVYNEQVVCSSVQTQVSKQHCKSCAKHGCDHCQQRGWWYRFERFNPNDFGLVVCDEAHHAAADSWRRVVAHYMQNSAAKALGVTATPQRGDGIGLHNVFDICPYEMPITKGISEGYLVPLKQHSVTVVGLDLSRVATRGGDLSEGELQRAFLGEDEARRKEMLHKVARPLDELAEDRQAIIFASGWDHAADLAAALNEYPNSRAECVLGETNPFERDQIFRRFKSGETNRLVNVGVATEGFDCPAASVVALVRPTKSISLYLQMIGRGTRTLPGVVDGPATAEARKAAIAASSKPDCLIIDFCGISGPHKLITMVDALAGEMAEDLRVEMAAVAREAGEALSIEELEQRVQALREKRREAEQRRQELKRDGYYASSIEYTVDSVDLYGDSSKARAEVVWEQRTGTLTEKQFKYLTKLGVAPEKAADWTVRQAGAVIDSMTKGTGADYRIPFGKHAGKTLNQVPRGYLRWAKDNIASPAFQKNIAIMEGRQQKSEEPAF